MISILKSPNLSVVFLASLLLLFLTRFCAAFSPIESLIWQSDLAPFSMYINSFLENSLLQSKFFHFAFSALLVLIQAFFITKIYEVFKVEFDNSNYFIAWIYVCFTQLFPSFIYVSPILIATTLLLVIFYQISRNEKPNSITTSFNSGILLAISFLFWYPSILFIVFIVFATNTFSILTFRKILALLIGLVIPFLYLVVIYFLMDKLDDNFIKLFSEIAFFKVQLKSKMSLNILISLIPIAVGFGAAIIFVLKSINVVKERRHFISTIIMFLLIGLSTFLFQTHFNFLALIIVVFPLSIFFLNLINIIERRFITEIVHLSLLLPVLFNSIFPLFK